jgi:hypothetical protein
MRPEHEVHAALRLEWAHVQVVPQLPDRVDPDLITQRLEHIEVWMRTAQDAVVLAQQLGGERQSGGPLPDTGRSMEEVRVRGPLLERRAEQALRLSLFRHVAERAHEPPSRSA